MAARILRRRLLVTAVRCQRGTCGAPCAGAPRRRHTGGDAMPQGFPVTPAACGQLRCQGMGMGMRRGQLLAGRAALSPHFEGSNVRARAGRGWPRRPPSACSPEGIRGDAADPPPAEPPLPATTPAAGPPSRDPRSLPLLAAAGPIPTREAPRRGRGGSCSRSFVCLPQRHTPRRRVGPGSCVRE